MSKGIYDNHQQHCELITELTKWYDDAGYLRNESEDSKAHFYEKVDSMREKAKVLDYNLESWIRLLELTRK